MEAPQELHQAETSIYRAKEVVIAVFRAAILCLVGVVFTGTPLEMPRGMAVVEQVVTDMVLAG